MGTNELIRRKFQAGIEGTRGTLVPATRIIYADIQPSYDRTIQDFPDRSGTYFRRRRVAYNRPTIGFSFTDLLTYEDLPWWMELGIKGGVTGVTDAGTPPAFTYTFQPSAATDDIKSITLEHGEPGNRYTSTQVMLNTWNLRIAPDNDAAWMLDGELVGRDWETLGAYTALTDRTTEAIRAAGTTIAIDDATLGTTPVTGKVIDASITCNLNLHMKAFLEDDQSWAANKVGRDARDFDATITFEFDDDVEFAKYRSSTAVERKIRIQRTGSNIHGTPNTPKSAQIDMHGYWSSIGFGDRQGNMTATFGFQSFYNVSAAYDTRVVVVNDLATLP